MAPKEIHAILTETLACFFHGWTKDLSAPLYKIKSEALSSNHCGHAEAISITCFEFVSVALGIQRAKFARSIILSSVA